MKKFAKCFLAVLFISMFGAWAAAVPLLSFYYFFENTVIEEKVSALYENGAFWYFLSFQLFALAYVIYNGGFIHLVKDSHWINNKKHHGG